MNKKIFIIIAILVVLVILLFPKVISLNDGGTKIYKSLIYEITKAHKIREGGYLVEGTIIKVFGKQIYCDIPKDVKIIEDGKEKNEANTTHENNEEISLLVMEDTITSKGATFILKNNTDEDYAYEPSYYLEKKEDNKWNEIALEEPLTWNSVILTLKARDEIEINVDWSITGYGVLKDGEYRLVKTNFRKTLSPDSRAYSVYAEFEVKEDNSLANTEYSFYGKIIEIADKGKKFKDSNKCCSSLSLL